MFATNGPTGNVDLERQIHYTIFLHLAGIFENSTVVHCISLSTWDLGLEEIRAISDFAL